MFGDPLKQLVPLLNGTTKRDGSYGSPAATPVLKVTAGAWSATDCNVDADSDRSSVGVADTAVDWDRSSAAVVDIPGDYRSSAGGGYCSGS